LRNLGSLKSGTLKLENFEESKISSFLKFASCLPTSRVEELDVSDSASMRNVLTELEKQALSRTS